MKAKRDYKYSVFYSDGRQEHGVARMDEQPTLKQLQAVVDPYLDGGDMEHVYVWNELAPDHRGDMFVDEMGVHKGLKRNEHATWLYRAATMRADPSTDPESLPCVVGSAVVFDDVVWR